MKIRLLVEQDEESVFSVHCHNLPRCISQVQTRDKALRDIKGVITVYLASQEKHQGITPLSLVHQ